MSGKLFAFQVARPLELPREEILNAVYDPQAQALVWQGGTRAQAVYCTGAWFGWQSCNAYGDYCSTWNGLVFCWVGGPCAYNCD